MNRWQRLGSLVAFGALVGLGFGAQGTIAQGAGDSHPAHIHAGSCTQLGDVVYPLTNVSAERHDARHAGHGGDAKHRHAERRWRRRAA